jgi:hypothetical protein
MRQICLRINRAEILILLLLLLLLLPHNGLRKNTKQLLKVFRKKYVYYCKKLVN